MWDASKLADALVDDTRLQGVFLAQVLVAIAVGYAAIKLVKLTVLAPSIPSVWCPLEAGERRVMDVGLLLLLEDRFGSTVWATTAVSEQSSRASVCVCIAGWTQNPPFDFEEYGHPSRHTVERHDPRRKQRSLLQNYALEYVPSQRISAHLHGVV